MKKNWPFKILIILLLSLTSGFLYNLFSNNGINLLYTPLEVKPGSHLKAEETYRLLREGQTLLIDSRYKKEFDISHIPGSINIPSNLPRDELMTVLESVSREDIIIVYCSSESCQSARRLAGLMTYLGYKQVHVYLAGFEDWLKKKYPIEK